MRRALPGSVVTGVIPAADLDAAGSGSVEDEFRDEVPRRARGPSALRPRSPSRDGDGRLRRESSIRCVTHLPSHSRDLCVVFSVRDAPTPVLTATATACPDWGSPRRGRFQAKGIRRSPWIAVTFASFQCLCATCRWKLDAASEGVRTAVRDERVRGRRCRVRDGSGCRWRRGGRGCCGRVRVW